MCLGRLGEGSEGGAAWEGWLRAARQPGGAGEERLGIGGGGVREAEKMGRGWGGESKAGQLRGGFREAEKLRMRVWGAG